MYQLTIGLEIHVELKTKTKMFCGCLNPSASSGLTLSNVERVNDPAAPEGRASPNGRDEKKPNKNICPICLAHPGTLPTINKKAVESVLKLGLALDGEIPKTSKFDRKNYFYPDLPKGYQISQYDQPLVIGGELNGIKLRRIHLEEDTARLVHSPDGKSSLVDFNRAGIPLMELVTKPVIKSSKEAVIFAKELQLILRYLGISDADMEKGQMRVEANISIQDSRWKFEEGFDLKSEMWSFDGKVNDEPKLNAKVEIKNLNSFRAVEEAVDYEIKRQTEILEKGEEVRHETRGWDDNKKATVSQRAKEEAHDYRYFPEPDLPPLDLTSSGGFSAKGGPALGWDIEKLKAEIPELPSEKRKRLAAEYGLKSEQTEILVDDSDFAQYFEESVSELKTEITDLESKNLQILYNYLTTDLRGLINEQGITVKELKITPENFADLIVLIIKGEISSRIAKNLLKEMHLTGLDPHKIIQEKGLSQISDEEVIKKAIQETAKENLKAVEDYKKGQENALQFLIGQAMRKLKGKANPDILRKLFEDYLSK